MELQSSTPAKPHCFAIMIADGPNSRSEQLGRQFVREALRKHSVRLVFFYHRGVEVMDDPSLAQQWANLRAAGVGRLTACSAAAERRRGAALTPAVGWEIASLAQWWDAVLKSDRVVRFGPERSSMVATEEARDG